jgi:hypothetical protein
MPDRLLPAVLVLVRILDARAHFEYEYERPNNKDHAHDPDAGNRSETRILTYIYLIRCTFQWYPYLIAKNWMSTVSNLSSWLGLRSFLKMLLSLRCGIGAKFAGPNLQRFPSRHSGARFRTTASYFEDECERPSNKDHLQQGCRSGSRSASLSGANPPITDYRLLITEHQLFAASQVLPRTVG